MGADPPSEWKDFPRVASKAKSGFASIIYTDVVNKGDFLDQIIEDIGNMGQAKCLRCGYGDVCRALDTMHCIC